MQSPTFATKASLLVFSILTFYCFGVAIALQYIAYPPFDKVHEHWQDFMNLFNQQMTILLFIPYALLAVAALVLYKFGQKEFDKKTMAVSVGLTVFVVVCTFLFIYPIQHKLPLQANFDGQTHQNLVNYTLYLQILPQLLM